VSKRIEISSIINLIHFKNKAITYFLFAGNALSLPKRFYTSETFAFKAFRIKHELNQTSSVFYFAFRIIALIYKRTNQLLRMSYSREEQQFLINMLIKKKTFAARLIPKKLYIRPSR
jgi:hypothetical protein